MKTGKTLEDELPTARYFGVGFAPDGASLYYARNNKEGTLLYQHVLGTRISATRCSSAASFTASARAATICSQATVTDDGRYLVVRIDRGVPAKRVDIVFRDLTKPARLSTFWSGAWIRASPPSMPRAPGT